MNEMHIRTLAFVYIIHGEKVSKIHKFYTNKVENAKKETKEIWSYQNKKIIVLFDKSDCLWERSVKN